MKNLVEYHDLYLQSKTLLLADVFEKFRNICLEIYEFDPEHFLTATGLAQEGALKKTKVKSDLSTAINVINDRKRYQSSNMSCYLSIWIN